MTRSGDARTAVFLDRDGVINRPLIRDGRPYSPRNFYEFEILPDVKEAVTLLKKENLEVVVVTNQPDIANHFVTKEFVHGLHKRLNRILGLRHFYVCEHNDQDECECRKPKAGLLRLAGSHLNLNLKESFLVGDRWKDIQAGQEVGCKCYFIDYKYAEKNPEPPFVRVASLMEATKLILEKTI